MWLHLTIAIIYAKIHCQIVTKTHLIILGLFQSQSLLCSHKNKSQICKCRQGTKQNGNLNICCKIPQAHIYRIVCYSHANFVDFVWFLNLLFFGWALVVCGLALVYLLVVAVNIRVGERTLSFRYFNRIPGWNGK